MRLTWILICCAAFFCIPGWISPVTEPVGFQTAMDYFRAEAPLFAASCRELRLAIQAIPSDTAHASPSIAAARQRLKESRSHYKKIESFLEYFFLNSAHVYNSPPKFEGEEPFMEYQEPVGLQVIEFLLYERDVPAQRTALMEQAETVASSADDLLSLLYDFKADDRQILESLRIELIRIMALGITGYDAPLLKTGIAESYEALQSLRIQLQPYLSPGTARSDSLQYRLDQAISYLRDHTQAIYTQPQPGIAQPTYNQAFDTFDRLTFLKDYAAPLQYQLGQLIREKGLELNTTGVLNYSADNLFSPDALIVDNFGRINPPASSGSSTKPLNNAPAVAALIQTGRRLFFDKTLSGNGTKSCASCHAPEKMFTDNLPRSIAFDGHSSLDRNAPTLLYCGFQYSQFWDGRATTLEQQIRTVLHDPREMNTRLNARETDSIALAIAAFVRSLHPMNAPFDRFMSGNANALTAREKNGANLFMGKAQCATCHFIPLFNGLIPPDYRFTEFEVLGTTATDDFLNPRLSNDSGKYRIYPLPFNQAAFKTPTVRNSARTAPYMHNGAFSSLEKVLEFYNKGGGAGLGLKVPAQTLPAAPLGLSQQEMDDIILFLHTLTDTLATTH
jgi:cytochrome c peroxidase